MRVFPALAGERAAQSFFRLRRFSAPESAPASLPRTPICANIERAAERAALTRLNRRGFSGLLFLCLRRRRTLLLSLVRQCD